MSTMVEVKLPQTTDEPMDSVVILWYKAEGDRVEAHDVLVEVQTEKATFEIEAPTSGVLKEIRVKRAETASIGDTLAVIEEVATGEAAALAQGAPGSRGSATGGHPGAGVEVRNADRLTDANRRAGAGPAASTGFVQAPPRMRRLAVELGVDLARVQGTGPNGRITEDDVRSAAATGTTANRRAEAAFAAAQTSTAERAVAPSVIRQATARRMMQSLQQSAQLTLHAWADITELSERHSDLAQEVGWTAWVLRAVSLALQTHPVLNASWTEDGMVQHERVNLGLAVDTEFGLVVPVIADAPRLTVHELQAQTSRLAEMVRVGTLPAETLSGGTFTVTNLGAYGVEFFTPILNPPQAGILGVGAVEDKVVPAGRGLAVVQRMPLSLTFDHRVSDGGPAARFLQAVTSNLANPGRLV